MSSLSGSHGVHVVALRCGPTSADAARALQVTARQMRSIAGNRERIVHLSSEGRVVRLAGPLRTSGSS